MALVVVDGCGTGSGNGNRNGTERKGQGRETAGVHSSNFKVHTYVPYLGTCLYKRHHIIGQNRYFVSPNPKMIFVIIPT